jgi:hypothetical protein
MLKYTDNFALNDKFTQSLKETVKLFFVDVLIYLSTVSQLLVLEYSVERKNA